MAIQGILKGFADPIDASRFVALVGRGANYILVFDGLGVGAYGDLESGSTAFDQACVGVVQPSWVEVRGLSTAVNTGVSTVTEVGSRTRSEFPGEIQS